MAKIGEFEVASRYDGIVGGPRHEYTFETQDGIPIDGGNKLLRELSPFRLRLVPPDALLIAASRIENGVDLQSTVGSGTGGTEAASIRLAQARAVNLINAAAQGADQNTLAGEVSTVLANVAAVNTEASTLESFIASGQFAANQASDYFVTLSDAFTASDIALQLKRILAAPTLTLLVNPNNMTINFTNIQTYSARTRFGFIFERWGEEQPTISFSGVTGAFIAGSSNAPGTLSTLAQVTGESGTPTGVQWASKRDSAAFQNLMNLIQFFKSNGYIYDTVNATEAHLFVGAIAIDYDQWTYVGHIEAFNWGYASDKPHHIEWSMEFTVDRMFDNAQSPAVVLPQTSPTESPQGFIGSAGGTSGVSLGDALAGVASADLAPNIGNQAVMPFDLLE